MIPASKRKLMHCDLKINVKSQIYLREGFSFFLEITYIRALWSVGKAKHRWTNTWSVAYIDVNKKNPPMDKDQTLKHFENFEIKILIQIIRHLCINCVTCGRVEIEAAKN